MAADTCEPREVMRIAIVADIHGNFRALQAVLADIDEQNIEGIISLGDNIGYGPEPNEVIDQLRARGVLSVMGNHELALFNPACYNRLNPITQQSIDITRELLSPANATWVKELPYVALRHEARFVHGCPPSSLTTYLFHPSPTRLSRIFYSYDERICFCGHTHGLSLFTRNKEGIIHTHSLRPGTTELSPDDRHLIIPGSVGQPRDSSDKNAKYCIWDIPADFIILRSISYDVATTVRLIHERGLPVVNASRLQ